MKRALKLSSYCEYYSHPLSQHSSLVVPLEQQVDLSQHSVFAFPVVRQFPTPVAYNASDVAKAIKAMITSFFILKKNYW